MVTLITLRNTLDYLILNPKRLGVNGLEKTLIGFFFFQL